MLDKIILVIECDGFGHKELEIEFGGELGLTISEIRNKQKDEFCLNNSIKMVRINLQNFENADKIIKNALKEKSKQLYKNK